MNKGTYRMTMSYLQYVYLTKDFYPECLKNPYKAATETQTTWRKAWTGTFQTPKGQQAYGGVCVRSAELPVGTGRWPLRGGLACPPHAEEVWGKGPGCTVPTDRFYFLYPHPRTCFHRFQREEGREGNIEVRKKHWLAVSGTPPDQGHPCPNQGSNLQHRSRALPGNQTGSPWVIGWRSTEPHRPPGRPPHYASHTNSLDSGTPPWTVLSRPQSSSQPTSLRPSHSPARRALSNRFQCLLRAPPTHLQVGSDLGWVTVAKSQAPPSDYVNQHHHSFELKPCILYKNQVVYIFLKNSIVNGSYILPTPNPASYAVRFYYQKLS